MDTKSGVFGAYSSGRVSKEKKARKPLLVGIGAAALWPNPPVRNAAESTGTAPVVHAAAPVRLPLGNGAPMLKLDADYAAFAARVASEPRSTR